MEVPVMSVFVMIILGCGMFYGQLQYKRKGAEWGKTLTIACGICIIVIALWANVCRSSIDNTYIRKEREYERVQAIVLAKALIDQYKGGSGKCLVIYNPNTIGSPESLAQLVDAFTDGLGGSVSEVRPVPIKAEIPADAPLVLVDMMGENTAAEFNKVIQDNKDCDIIISMADLPSSEAELYGMDIFAMIEDPGNRGSWIRDPKLKYPLLGIYEGNPGNLEALFSEGLITAMTLWRPNPVMDEEPIPDDIMEAFNKRYTLITPANFNTVKLTFPGLFPRPGKK